jgi:hypothetical protein
MFQSFKQWELKMVPVGIDGITDEGMRNRAMIDSIRNSAFCYKLFLSYARVVPKS